jgi:hypothetical protein
MGTIDDFEAGSIDSGYEDTSNVSLDTSPVYSGSQSLAISDGYLCDNDASIFAFGTDSEISFYLQISGYDDAKFFFGTDGTTSITGTGPYPDNGFVVSVGRFNGMRMSRYDSNSLTTIASNSSYDINTSTWYKGILSWSSGGTITWRVEETDGTLVGEISATDTTHTGDGWGPACSGGANFDLIESPDTASSATDAGSVTSASASPITATESALLAVDEPAPASVAGNGSTYYNTPNSTEINDGSFPNRTLMTWIRHPSPGSATNEIAYEEGGGTNAMSFYVDEGDLVGACFVTGGDASDQFTTYLREPINAGEWVHAALTLDGPVGSVDPSGTKLYINGELVASGDGAELNSHTGDIELLGGTIRLDTGSTGGSRFTGDVDVLSIHNATLTQSEIEDAMYGAVPGTGKVAEWRMDDAGEDTLDDATTDHDFTLGGGTAASAAPSPGSYLTARSSPITSTETTAAGTVDSGTATAASASPLTSTETATATEAGATVQASASPLTSTETATATEAGTVTAASASPLTSTETGTATEAGTATAASASPLTSTETATATEAGTVTTAVVSPLTSTETTTTGTTVTDSGAATAASASPLTSTETGTATEAGTVTAAAASPLASTESPENVRTDAGSTVQASASPLTSTETPVAVDAGGVFAASASPLVSAEVPVAVDVGVVTVAVASPLTSTETPTYVGVPILDTGTLAGSYEADGELSGSYPDGELSGSWEKDQDLDGSTDE